MAIEVVGNDEKARRRVTCRKCGSIIAYLLSDVESKDHTDYSGVSETYYFVRCPTCKERVMIRNH